MWTLICIMSLLFAVMTNNFSLIYSSVGTVIILILLYLLILLWKSLPLLNGLLWPLRCMLEWFWRRPITSRLSTIISGFRSSFNRRLPGLKSVASSQLNFMLSFPGFTEYLINSGVIKHSDFQSVICLQSIPISSDRQSSVFKLQRTIYSRNLFVYPPQIDCLVGE